jgi:hypothetical protein
MNSLKFKNPSITISEWFPMGRNNLLTLNRHLGSHKSYTSPTEFGMEGELKDLEDGAFKMLENGCFLKPIDFTFTGKLKAELRNSFKEEKAKGVLLDKDGSSLVGICFDTDLPIDKAKSVIRNLETEFTKQFLPLLTENQLSLLKCTYGVENNTELQESLSSYALVITESIGIPIEDSKQFIEDKRYKNILAPVTDWVIHHFTLENCHVFIGMKAMVCIGSNLSPRMIELLKGILFQKTIFNITLRMFSNLWVTTKRLTTVNLEIPNAGFNKLKKFNEELSLINTNFSREIIFNDILTEAIANKNNEWVKLIKNNNLAYLDIGEGLKEELDKAEERELLIKQMHIDIASLKDQLQNRMNMIMTKNGQQLNLTLLLLTLISVLGVAEIIGFSRQKTIIVTVALIPFLIFTVRSFIYYKKNFSH